jgi:HEPN domain-containing protein
LKPLERPEVLAWWALAQSDLRVAGVVAGLQPPESHLVCFLCQQAGEKAIKAVLEAYNRPVPRTHSLMVLRAALPPEAGETAAMREPAAVLTDYGVGPRYPSIALPVNQSDALEALAAARHLVAWAGRVLGADIPEGNEAE